MSTIEIKNSFHKLIDSIDNDNILLKFYDLLERAVTVKPGYLWNRLTKEEQEELLKIASETDNEENLISHSAIQAKHKKWLD